MTEIIRKKLSDSASARWIALLIVAFTMMMGYFITDVMSPLEVLLTAPKGEGGLGLGWSSTEYGFFSGAYGYINVFLLMLFFGGLILDKCGIRFTGILSSALMFVGALIKFYAVTNDFSGTIFGFQTQVLIAALGFAIFGVGAEITGITVSKVIAKWFTGHELALALGTQVALARLGTAAALAFSLPIAKQYHTVGAPILLGVVCLLIGLLAFIVYTFMDRKLDASSTPITESSDDEGFKLSDLKLIFTNKGFWLITLLCLMFYSGVFPFLKFAAKLMVAKYNVPSDMAGAIPAVLPFGTIFLTPLFGTIYDKIGRGATLMIIGSVMLTCVHVLFALPILPYGWFAIIVMIVLGIAFSLVPSAMWPSVPKIIPLKQLGSAYAIIFYIQNIGLALVPLLIGWVNGQFNNYTLTMAIFAIFGFIAIFIAILLKYEDGVKQYGLEKANIKK